MTGYFITSLSNWEDNQSGHFIQCDVDSKNRMPYNSYRKLANLSGNIDEKTAYLDSSYIKRVSPAASPAYLSTLSRLRRPRPGSIRFSGNDERRGPLQGLLVGLRAINALLLQHLLQILTNNLQQHLVQHLTLQF